MRINLENYELFMIDYLEDNLNDETLKEFKLFLETNKSIAEELELIKGFDCSEMSESRDTENIDFSFLKKQESITVSDDQLIALMEGDLEPVEQEELERIMEIYPEVKIAYNQFLMTKLPLENIVFENKESLKRRPATKYFKLDYMWVSAAATLLLIGLLGYLVKQKPKEQRLAYTPNKVLEAKQSKLEPTFKIEPKATVLLTKLKSESSIDRNLIEVNTIESRTIELTENSELSMNEPQMQLAELHIMKEKPLMAKDEKPFLKPGEYLVQRIREDLLVNVGLSFHQEVNSETQVRRYGLISKYFAYERIEKTN